MSAQKKEKDDGCPVESCAKVEMLRRHVWGSAGMIVAAIWLPLAGVLIEWGSVKTKVEQLWESHKVILQGTIYPLTDNRSHELTNTKLNRGGR